MTDGIPAAHTLNTLLPAARIHVFSNSDHTTDLLLSLQGDWRFGRVVIERFEGGVDAAIARYKNEQSPTVLVIQTDDISDAFQSKLHDLANVCAEGTAALLIGPVNDVQLYRRLIAMGISDYLVHPVSLFTMADAFARTLLRVLGASTSKLIAVVGAKGGVGTTHIAEHVAMTISERLQQKTLLMDAAAGQSTLWAQLSSAPTGSLTEAAKAAIDRDHDTLSRILVALSDNLTFLNTGAEPILDVGSARQVFEMMLERMLAQYPVVVVDLSSTTNSIRSGVLARAQGAVCVSTPMVQSLSLAKTLLSEIRALRGNDASDIRFVLNKRGEATAHEVPTKDITASLGQAVALEIPYAPKLFLRAESEAKADVLYPEGIALQDKWLPILSDLLGVEARGDAKHTGGGIGGLIRKLKG